MVGPVGVAPTCTRISGEGLDCSATGRWWPRRDLLPHGALAAQSRFRAGRLCRWATRPGYHRIGARHRSGGIWFLGLESHQHLRVFRPALGLLQLPRSLGEAPPFGRRARTITGSVPGTVPVVSGGSGRIRTCDPRGIPGWQPGAITLPGFRERPACVAPWQSRLWAQRRSQPLVDAAGFAPAFSCLRGRRLPARLHARLVHEAGFDPAPPGSEPGALPVAPLVSLEEGVRFGLTSPRRGSRFRDGCLQPLGHPSMVGPRTAPGAPSHRTTLARTTGVEPATFRSTAGCSALELRPHLRLWGCR